MNQVQETFPTPTDVVSLATAKNHLRVEHSTDDALVTTLIGVAFDHVTAYTNAHLAETKVSHSFDTLGEYTNIHVGPRATISADEGNGVSYMNAQGVRTYLNAADYEFDGGSYPARLRLLNEPTDVKETLNAWRIDTKSGYTDPTRPDALVAAMLLVVGHLYENRQDVTPFRVFETPMASRYLMNPHRLKSFT